MACHKILIDYTEYVRLKKCEARYEEQAKVAEEKRGTGASTLVQSMSPDLRPPLMNTTESITLPPSANLDTHQTKEAQTRTNNANSKTDKHWYYLGLPKRST